MFCAQCGASNDATAKFCFKCGAPLSQAPVPPPLDPRTRGGAPPPPPVESRSVTGKNPVLATVLSLLIVGVGQFYNGDNKKGAIMLVVALVAAAPTLGLGWLAASIWSAIDAYRVANGTARRW
jgi:TM2 domain-containing membrane protein YozV